MCPRCHSMDLSRSQRRRLWDLPMLLWNLRPIRCRQCHSRFYLPAQLASQIDACRKWTIAVRRHQT